MRPGHGTSRTLFVPLVCLVLLAGCTGEPREAEVLPEPTSPVCEGVAPRTLDEVFAAHFSALQPTGCTTGCHAQGLGGLTFHDARELWQATVNKASSEDAARQRVVPGRPELSQLYLKLLPDAQGRMPQGGPYLDDAALRDVAGWICAGAPEPSSTSADGGTPPADAGTDNPAPTLSSLNPTSVATNGAPFTLTLTGTGFIPSSTVVFNGSDVTTAYVDASTLTARIPTLAAAGGYAVLVRNPAPGGGVSNALTLTAANTSGPTLTGLDPVRAVAGMAFTLTVTGSGYVCNPTASRSTVLVNGVTYTVSSCTTTQLAVSLPALTTGDYAVQVKNANGDTSNTATLQVSDTNPVPTLATLSPCGLVAGAADFTLTLTGTGFAPGASVTFNGSPVTVSFVGSSELRATIPASLVATAPANDAAALIVTNPAPGGGASAPVYFGVATQAITLAGGIQKIFTDNCTSGCHGSPGTPVNLTDGRSYGELVGVASSGCPSTLRVRACGPLRGQSVLIDKLLASSTSPACAGAPMPKGAPLPAADKQRIIDWVAQGAPQ